MKSSDRFDRALAELNILGNRADYFRTFKAPHKERIWFERSGHFVPFEEPEKFNRAMVEKVLKNSRPLPNRISK